MYTVQKHIKDTLFVTNAITHLQLLHSYPFQQRHQHHYQYSQDFLLKVITKHGNHRHKLKCISLTCSLPTTSILVLVLVQVYSKEPNRRGDTRTELIKHTVSPPPFCWGAAGFWPRDKRGGGPGKILKFRGELTRKGWSSFFRGGLTIFEDNLLTSVRK